MEVHPPSSSAVEKHKKIRASVERALELRGVLKNRPSNSTANLAAPQLPKVKFLGL